MKKIISLILSLSFVFNIFTVNAFALDSEEYNEAVAFIRNQGFLASDIEGVEVTKEGFKFSASYLPNNEISYIFYEKESDGVKLTITEGNKSNEIVYKNNGYVYLDGIRNNLLEKSYVNTNSVSNRATVAISTYENIEDVPGYESYWKNRPYDTPSAGTTVLINLTATLTVGALSRLIAGAFDIPVALAFIFNGMSADAINFFLGLGIATVALNIYNNRRCKYNPQTLQYLYEVNTSGAILGTSLSNKPTFYRLESYN